MDLVKLGNWAEIAIEIFFYAIMQTDFKDKH